MKEKKRSNKKVVVEIVKMKGGDSSETTDC